MVILAPMRSLLFAARRELAWFALLILALIVWSGMIGAPEWIWALAAVAILGTVAVGSFTHARRVRLIAERIDASTLAVRHRRQVEVPFPAAEAFAIADAAIRELPRVESVESARDSLQVHARLFRVDPYERRSGGLPASRRARRRRNLVHATVAPGERSASVTLICEPEGGVWVDWFLVDHGTNLENAEAVTRAISRRVSERRQEEEAKARETATEKELTVARLSLLHAQVEPHFLYNTLASAQLLTRGDPALAERMLGHLIVYLRHSVPRAESALSTLGEEVERARAYLEILRIRMGERLALQVEVPEALARVPMPPMMVQTLVENAIKHGLEPVVGGGTVWIRAREVDGKVAVTVADDGRGLGGEAGGTGIGLHNVRERLRLAYGEAASFAIASNFPRGVAATISVPASGPAPEASRA